MGRTERERDRPLDTRRLKKGHTGPAATCHSDAWGLPLRAAMTVDSPYELQRVARDRVSIVLRGELREASVSGLGHDLATLLSAAEDSGLPSDSGIIFDLGDVERCDPAACRTLARIQRRLGAHGCRTAWLAHRPRLRGVAWWIVQAARDGHAMPVLDERAAEAWLAADGERGDAGPEPRRGSRPRAG